MFLKNHYLDKFTSLVADIKRWGKEFGFHQVGIASPDLKVDAERFNDWLEHGYHGAMQYLENHRDLRSDVNGLMPDTRSIICCRINYRKSNEFSQSRNSSDHGCIAAYAFGIDYHKFIRKRLLAFAKKILIENGKFNYRVFCGSAPVLEKALAAKAGLGWIGKNALLINVDAGSYFFLGEIFTDLLLPPDRPVVPLCGDCKNCLEKCPTKALISPHKIDARRCIAYLTIENRAAIPEEFRALIGNKIFGCDVCQEVCPWNLCTEDMFCNKRFFDLPFLSKSLAELLLWDEKTFLRNTKDTVLRRIKYESWLRNITVALGNTYSDDKNRAKNIAALRTVKDHPSELVRDHVKWAISKLLLRSS